MSKKRSETSGKFIKSEDTITHVVAVRFNAKDKATIQDLGGAVWLRQLALDAIAKLAIDSEKEG